MGVHFIKGKNVVLIADTFNHKIKVVDPFTNQAFSWLGSGKGDFKDDMTENACFNEPNSCASLTINSNVLIFITD